MFSVAPNILLAPNMMQNAERKHRTQNANTAHNRCKVFNSPPVVVCPGGLITTVLSLRLTPPGRTTTIVHYG